MIKYALKCSQGHQFEGWFQSAGAFDDLLGRGLTSCVECGDTTVEKALMAPRVQTEPKGNLPAKASVPAAAPTGTDLNVSPQEEAVAKLRAHVEANSDYVGSSFAEAARDMHDGVTKPRAIHGEAKVEDARALIEDGVPVLPLPFGPKTKAN